MHSRLEETHVCWLIESQGFRLEQSQGCSLEHNQACGLWL
jgi:hypothetical protein